AGADKLLNNASMCCCNCCAGPMPPKNAPGSISAGKSLANDCCCCWARFPNFSISAGDAADAESLWAAASSCVRCQLYRPSMLMVITAAAASDLVMIGLLMDCNLHL